MKVSGWLRLAAVAPLALAGCNNFGEAMTAHTDVVARAAGNEFRIEDAAQLLAANPEVPADRGVVEMLAGIWVDYTLLATAAAEDTTLAVINMERFTQEAREQAIIWKLREQVIRADTAFTDEQLQQRWASDGPGAEIRARHILLRIPAEATPQQREELRQQAEQLRQRAAGGENFAQLAEQFSQDPGSAQRGGDLGFFGRGRMVAPFEEAAFRMQPGEISPVVESPFGFHVIRLEERRQQELGDQRDQFRAWLVQQSEQEAETRYLDSLTNAANVQIRPGGLAVVREIAQQPDVNLRGRQANREIATYEGGSLTSGTVRSFVRTQPPHMQTAFASASDEQLESVVQQLTRKEILVREAQARGITLSQEEETNIRNEARDAIRQVLAVSGFAQQAGPQRTAAVINQQVRELIEGAIRGERQLIPLGPLGIALREAYPNDVNQNAFAQVVRRMEEIRASQPQLQQPAGPALPGDHDGLPGAPSQPAMPQQQPQVAPPAP